MELEVSSAGAEQKGDQRFRRSGWSGPTIAGASSVAREPVFKRTCGIEAQLAATVINVEGRDSSLPGLGPLGSRDRRS